MVSTVLTARNKVMFHANFSRSVGRMAAFGSGSTSWVSGSRICLAQCGRYRDFKKEFVQLTNVISVVTTAW